MTQPSYGKSVHDPGGYMRLYVESKTNQDDTRLLLDWLQSETRNKGIGFQAAYTQPKTNELGVAQNAIEVIAGDSAAAISALSTALAVWIRTRRAKIHLERSSKEGSRRAIIEAPMSAKEVAHLIQTLSNDSDD